MLTMLELAKRPSGLWRWALMVLFSAGVVIGLLGMHTLSSGHSEHSVTSVSAPHQDHAESAGPLQVLDEGCADCGSTQGHAALMLVCVLGLLVTLLLLVRPIARGTLRLHGRDASFRQMLVPDSWVSRTLSLHELSISRT